MMELPERLTERDRNPRIIAKVYTTNGRIIGKYPIENGEEGFYACRKDARVPVKLNEGSRKGTYELVHDSDINILKSQ